ncbi:MAG: hypothetical protein M1473_10080 [Firmicutes bacterium]|nr:hypothetical protein [Bacillota bacterium]
MFSFARKPAVVPEPISNFASQSDYIAAIKAHVAYIEFLPDGEIVDLNPLFASVTGH